MRYRVKRTGNEHRSKWWIMPVQPPVEHSTYTVRQVAPTSAQRRQERMRRQGFRLAYIRGLEVYTRAGSKRRIYSASGEPVQLDEAISLLRTD